jgi:hypothetical protein
LIHVIPPAYSTSGFVLKGFLSNKIILFS